MTAPRDFYYFECRDCELSLIDLAGYAGDCPLCLGDNGRSNRMAGRPAVKSDRPEGRDARTVEHRP